MLVLTEGVRSAISGVRTLARQHRRALLHAAVALIGTMGVATAVAAAVLALEVRRAYVESANVVARLALNTGPQATLVFDRFDAPTFVFHTERRVDVPLDRMSPYVVAAVLSAEDRRFFEHHGFDPVRIAGAFLSNLRAGHIVEGASTITQQLVRSLTGDRERTYARKLREIFMAIHLERRFDKRAILQTYLNRVYFGEGYHGVEAAARGFFDRPALEVRPHEAAALAAAIKAPVRYSPTHRTPVASERRQAVLRAMRENDALSDGAYAAARRAPLRVAPRGRMHDDADPPHAPGDTTLCGLYFKAAVRRQLVERFGWDQVYEGGLRVYTTFDPAAQRAAERAVARRLDEIGPTREGGDGHPLQGALVAIDPPTGHVHALVGGRDFHRSPFNRATQARRQPGSAFKPLLYAAALEYGFTPGARLHGLDATIDAFEGEYLPADRYEDPSLTLRRALTISSNRAAVHLLERLGVQALINYSRRFGISARLPAVPSLALGTGEVTLLELTSAYGALANEGVLNAPVLIRRVEDASGRVLYEAPRTRRRAVRPTTAYLVSSMLADVINRGTGYRVRRAGFTRPAAGKTGSTDDFGDAWFLGYTPRLAAGIWFGFDEPALIMREGYGGLIAAPAWADFMMQATAEHEATAFRPPPEIIKVPICPLSGHRAGFACYLAAAGAPRIRARTGTDPVSWPPQVEFDLVVEGTSAAEPCALHGLALERDGRVGDDDGGGARTATGSVQGTASRFSPHGA